MTKKKPWLYAELLGELGAKQLFNNERLVFFGTDMATPMIAVGTLMTAKAATNGNGTMLAIPVGSRENVDKIYAKALALGATDEGAPANARPVFMAAISATLTAINSQSAIWGNDG